MADSQGAEFLKYADENGDKKLSLDEWMTMLEDAGLIDDEKLKPDEEDEDETREEPKMVRERALPSRLPT